MAATKFDELLSLDVEGRLDLISKLWDSIVDEQQSLPVTAAEAELLDQCVKEDDEDPEAAVPWDVAKAELLRSL